MIPVCEPTLSGNEIKYAEECIKSGWVSSSGKFIKEFEDGFSEYCGVKYGVSCSSGTAAIHLAIESMGIGKGDEVIIPTFTMVGACNAVIYSGAKPVLVDSEFETWNMDASKIEEKITKKTKAVMVMHTYGHPADMDEIKNISKDHNIPIIEDAAEAHGAEYKGKKAGSLGEIACFSFYANKIITCFPPETLILIKPPTGRRGLGRMKKIKDLKIGDTVLTFNIKTSEKEFGKVTETFEREYNEDLIEVFFSNNNKLSLTPNHPVYVINKGWKRTDELEIGDEVIQYNYRGLAYREMYTGKTYADIMDAKVAEKKKLEHSEKIKERHLDVNSGYSTVNWAEVGMKISSSNKGRKVSDEVKEIYRNAQLKRWKEVSKEGREQFRIKMKGLAAIPEMRRKKSEAAKKLGQNPEYRKKLSEGVKRAMTKETYWANYAKGMNMKPNKKEKMLINFLENNFPGEFGYNGDYRLKIRIDNLIPDFVNINGKKKVIDILGRYWHAEEEYYERNKRYKKEGYGGLMLWEDELKNPDVLKGRIKAFIYNPNVKIVKITKIGKKQYKGKVYNIQTEKNHNYFAYGILVHNCGEGGMVVTNNEKWAERASLLKNHFFGKTRFLHEEIGYNYRLTNLQAAIGLAQFERIEQLISARRKNAKFYNKLLSNVNGMTKPPEAAWAKNVYWMYGILIEGEFGRTMPELRDRLYKKGIDTRTFFIGMHKQPAYKKSKENDGRYDERFPDTYGSYPVADALERKGCYLPSSSHLTKEQITFIANSIKEIKEEL